MGGTKQRLEKGRRNIKTRFPYGRWVVPSAFEAPRAVGGSGFACGFLRADGALLRRAGGPPQVRKLPHHPGLQGESRGLFEADTCLLRHPAATRSELRGALAVPEG